MVESPVRANPGTLRQATGKCRLNFELSQLDPTTHP